MLSDQSAEGNACGRSEIGDGDNSDIGDDSDEQEEDSSKGDDLTY
jgi:hypothetical protein